MWPSTDTVSAYVSIKAFPHVPPAHFPFPFMTTLHQMHMPTPAAVKGNGTAKTSLGQSGLTGELGNGSSLTESSFAPRRRGECLLVRHQIVSAIFPRLWYANPAVSRGVSKWCAVRTESTLLRSNKFGKCFMLCISLKNSQYILRKAPRNLL